MNIKMKKDKTPLILIVDDIPKNLQVLSNILNKEGFNIAFASNGDQALMSISEVKPDLILLDIMMPEVDGYEVADKLKSNKETSEIPIIFLTGKAETEDIVKGFKHGAVDYITKPFNSVELISRVNTHLSLKLSKDELHRKNNELQLIRKELEETIASKDKFFSIISHDLKGPFSGFLGLSGMLADEYEDLTGEEIANIGVSLNSAANRLFSLLENLLNWSRTQLGRMEYAPYSIKLNEIVDKNIKIQLQTAQSKGIQLINEIKNDYLVYADENMLNTILRNLISNAIKFTDKDGYVKVYAESEEDFMVIYVEDNGLGMKKSAKEKIFRIDSKYSTHGTNNEKGTGLGLILCKELVETQGGKISFESEENKGTKFYFSIPKTKEVINK